MSESVDHSQSMGKGMGIGEDTIADNTEAIWLVHAYQTDQKEGHFLL